MLLLVAGQQHHQQHRPLMQQMLHSIRQLRLLTRAKWLKQTVGIGSNANDGTGDTLRAGAQIR